MLIAVASGKGGTGKTMISTNLASIISNATYADCDVEEPNGHLFLDPSIEDEVSVHIQAPVINNDLCTGCGDCARRCSFNALAVVKNKVLVFRELCHACGVCAAVCPEKAISEEPHELGKVRKGRFGYGNRFVDGFLNIGELRAAEIIEKVVDEVKGDELVILDAPPGTSCAAVAATAQADVVLLVTEPTPFGLHDLKLAHQMLNKLGVPHAVAINRADLGDDAVEKYCESEDLPVLVRIPFDRRIAELYAEGRMLSDGPCYSQMFADLAQKIADQANYSLGPSIDADAGELSKDAASQTGISPSRSLVVLSGKGGTGKTMLTACLAATWNDKAAADADVDAANLGILLEGKVMEEIGFSSGKKAEIDPRLCTGCGSCLDCRFSAISMVDGKAQVEEFKCEGCGLCAVVCPADAVTMKRPLSGTITVQDTPHSPLVSAELLPGAEASGRLVTQVRQHAEFLAAGKNIANILIDGSPGVGCPVNAALTGTHGVLLVAEPSRSSLHDLKRVVDLIDFFSIPRWVVINKHDLSPVMTREIERFCKTKGMDIIAKIPFDPTITESIVRCRIPSQDVECKSGEALRRLCKSIIDEFDKEKK
ncbi:4Fe-4S binding protein [candidate division WOR-3 bacterium]|nr:4Fe-4S binding protein [candidate division WOR-3 bacterium]